MIIIDALQSYNYKATYPDIYLEAVKAFALKIPNELIIRIENEHVFVEQSPNNLFDTLIQTHYEWINTCRTLFYSRVPLFFDTFIPIGLTDRMYEKYAEAHQISELEAKKECDLLYATSQENAWDLFCRYTAGRDKLNNGKSISEVKDIYESISQSITGRISVL